MAKGQKRSGREPKKPKSAVKKAPQSAASLFTDDSRMGKKPPRVAAPPASKTE